MALLEVKNLTVGIKSDNNIYKAVDDISFSIKEGEILGLTGESGCGKTTTALSITNLLPLNFQILNGEINFNGKSLSSLNEKEHCSIRGAEIGMVFQEVRQALNPLMKIGKQITEMQPSTEENHTLEILKSLGFEEPQKILDAYPHQLSRGMCQRVLLAIAVIRRPKLILADELSSALDDESQKRILSFLFEMNQKYKTAILIISHDLSIIQNFCNRFLVMHCGKIIEESSNVDKSTYLKENIYQKINNISVSSFVPPNSPIEIKPKTPLLTIKNVSNTYVSRSFGLIGKIKRKPVLKNVNLELQQGEIFGLSGRSGCGKTTLARCILGLINYNGEIILEGKNNLKHNQIQMVFQEPGASLNPCKSIGWLLEEPLVIHNLCPANERAQKVDEMLLKVGIDPSNKKRRIHEFSGGQKQRICIARALILKPHLLIADEAISSLDVSTGALILNLFKELHETMGLNILFISHNKDAVEYLCDRVAMMKNGEICS